MSLGKGELGCFLSLPFLCLSAGLMRPSCLRGIGGIWLLLSPWSPPVQLPVYIPSKEEQSDPRLFADNVRHFMVRRSPIRQSNRMS